MNHFLVPWLIYLLAPAHYQVTCWGWRSKVAVEESGGKINSSWKRISWYSILIKSTENNLMKRLCLMMRKYNVPYFVGSSTNENFPLNLAKWMDYATRTHCFQKSSINCRAGALTIWAETIAFPSFWMILYYETIHASTHLGCSQKEDVLCTIEYPFTPMHLPYLFLKLSMNFHIFHTCPVIFFLLSSFKTFTLILRSTRFFEI